MNINCAQVFLILISLQIGLTADGQTQPVSQVPSVSQTPLPGQTPPAGASITISRIARRDKDSIAKNEFTITADSIHYKKIVNSSVTKELVYKLDVKKDTFLIELRNKTPEYWKMVETRAREPRCDTLFPVIVTCSGPGKDRVFSIRHIPNCYPADINVFMGKLLTILDLPKMDNIFAQ